MRVERFTGEVPADLQLYNPRGLSVAIGMIVPQNKRRRVLGYRLDSVQAISGNNLKKSVTIAVTYQ